MRREPSHKSLRKESGPKGSTGRYIARIGGARFVIVASDGGGWDHVSVSHAGRCPTWEEMCVVKKWFFESTECVMQLHPPKSDHINIHPNCLHLWRPQTKEEIEAIRIQWEIHGEEWPYGSVFAGEIPMPPQLFV